MNSILSRVIAILLSLFTILYFGYQAYLLVNDPYVTDTALADNYTDQIELDGIAIKSEQLLIPNQTGVVHYTSTDAKKVLSGAEVAAIYANQSDLQTGVKLAEKKVQLETLQSIQEKKDSYLSSAQNIMASTKQAQLDLVDALQQNDFSAVGNAESDLLTNLLKQQYALNDSADFSAQIQELSNQVSSLEHSLSAPASSIIAPAAGYFTSEVDGYEAVLTPDGVQNFSGWSLEQLDDYMTSKPAAEQRAIGKVIDSTEWYFAAKFESRFANRMNEGDTILLSFSEGSGFQVKAKIDSVVVKDGEEVGMVLFKSSNMSNEVVDLRVEHATMILSTSKGIKVSKESIRLSSETEEDSTTTTTPGVYVDMGQVIRFRKLDVLFEGDDYVVCALHQDDPDYLQIYDEIILRGENLYDGKPI